MTSGVTQTSSDAKKNDNDTGEHLHWNDSYNTGDEKTDAEHHRLFALINEFQDAIQDHLESDNLAILFSVIVDTFNVHFSKEEVKTKILSYPNFESYIKNHCNLLSAAGRVKLNLEEKVAGAPGTAFMFLKNWVKIHIASGHQGKSHV